MMEWIVSSSVLIAVMAVLRRVLKGKLNPRLQYALWSIVLVRLLIPVSFFESGLSVQNVRNEVMETPQVQQVYTAVTAPIPVENYDRVYREVVQEYEAQGVNVEEMDESDVQTEVYSRMDTISVREVLYALWIAGMAVMAAALIGCNARFALRLRRSREEREVAYSPVPVYITGSVETPCFFGAFRPAIYLTHESAEDEQVKRYVLTHEITHYQQFDHIWAVLRAVCLVLHWYNPMVWLAFRLSRQDGEMACDEGTLMILGEEHRGNYGRTLIALATQTRLRGSLVTATTMADGKKAIKERIVILMKNPKTPFVTMIALILVCTLVVGCTFTGSIQGESKENGEETEPVETTMPAETTEPAQTTEPTETTPPENQITTNLNVTEEDPCFYWYKRLDGSGSGANWYNTAMGQLFSDASQINPYYLFYNGHYGGSWDLLDASTAAALEARGFDRDKGLQLMPRETLEWVMTEIFGTPLEQVMPDIPEGWVYLEETDTYYSNHDDAHGVTEFQIYGVEETDNGLIYVSYMPMGDSVIYGDGFRISGSSMVLTLQYDGEGDGYYVLANQLSGTFGESKITEPKFDCKIPEKPQSYKAENELTDEQIAQVNEAFYWEIREDNNYIYQKPISRFFTSYYSTPQEINLAAFLRNFSAQGIVEDWHQWIGEDEFAALAKQDDFPYKDEGVTQLSEMKRQVHKYTGEVVDAVIYRYTGIHLSELNDSEGRGSALYSKEYDAYYNFTSDVESGVFICTTGFVYDGYVVLYSEDAVLTLVEQNGRYYIYSHLPLEVTEYTELTDEQIAQVNEAFAPLYEVNGEMVVNPVCSFFTSYFASPAQINLADFMRYFSAEGVVADPDYEVTEEEFRALTELAEWPFGNVAKLDEMPVPVHGYPAKTVNAVLEKYAGVTLDDLNDAGKSNSSLMYLPAYETYYNFTSDFGLGGFTCTGGRIYDDHVELYSNNAILTLRVENGFYYIYSHQPAE